ncbi:MAG: sugar phosphate isomerase/epimerase [Anaerolineae bacterium]|nr:sugar phosphate isomerase/epimerase [Anaerolineae bacterium]
MTIEFAVFIKPWKGMTLAELGPHIRKMGFDLIELPVRPGFPCEPQEIETGLPKTVKALREAGVRVLNVTVSLPLDDERLYAACAAAGVTMNRVIFDRQGRNYWEAEKAAREKLDKALPFCEQYGIQIGIQHHYGSSMPVNEMGLYHLVKDYDPKYVGAIWDAAHSALEGMEPEPGLEAVESHLCVVNFKNAYWRRTSPPEAEVAEWTPYFTSGRQGRSSWKRVADKLRAMDYHGAVCFSAEYTAEHEVDRLIVEDLAFAKTLFN